MRGRPKLPKDKVKSNKIEIRFTDMEVSLYERLAKIKNKNLSVYIREILLENLRREKEAIQSATNNPAQIFFTSD